MRTHELTDALLREFAAVLEPRGYARRGQEFCLATGACRLCLHVSFIRHPADVDVTADVAVRHHAVEEVLNQGRPHLSDRAKRETATLGVELGNLAGTGQQRWRLARLADVSAAARDIVAWFERLGEPWLRRFGSLAEVYRVLGEGGPEARLICSLPETRTAVLAVARQLLRANITEQGAVADEGGITALQGPRLPGPPRR